MKMKTILIPALFLIALTLTGTARANGLADTSWNVIRYDNGERALASLIPGTEITAHFGADGRLYGTSGCNDYTTSYLAEGNQMVIRPAAATRKFCVLPEGLMQQEADYFDAIESAAAWRLIGSTLELFAKNGSPVVTMKLIKPANRSDDDEIDITINGETFRMKRVASDSGTKYEAADDPSTVFWSKGRTASLTVRGEEYSRYVLIRNSPDEDELFLSVDGENFRLHLVRTASGAKYEAEDDPSTYFWSKGDTATLFVRDKEYVGYNAGVPRNTNLPIGVEWTVQRIADEPVVPGSTVTLRFGHNARLDGKASVNTYRSSWIATDGRLFIKGAALTRMAAAQNLMAQEHKFLTLLENVRAYEVLGDTLILTTEDGAEIVAKR